MYLVLDTRDIAVDIDYRDDDLSLFLPEWLHDRYIQTEHPEEHLGGWYDRKIKTFLMPPKYDQTYQYLVWDSDSKKWGIDEFQPKPVPNPPTPPIDTTEFIKGLMEGLTL